MLFLFLLIDGLASPIGLTSIVARSNGTDFTMDGKFLSGKAIPVMFWPKEGEVWTNYCAGAQDLCCLKSMVEHYRNDRLQSLISSDCLQSLPSELVTNSMPEVELIDSGQFHAIIPSSTHFVGVLFVNLDPFFIVDAYQGFKMVVDGVVESNFLIAHNPCYSVIVPNTLVSICMHCNNVLPANAKYVWTSNWYVNYDCDWQCLPNYIRNGGGCEYAKSNIPYLELTMAFGSSFMIILILILLYRCRRVHKVVEIPTKSEEEKLPQKNEMIQFKGDLKDLQLRVKKH